MSKFKEDIEKAERVVLNGTIIAFTAILAYVVIIL